MLEEKMLEWNYLFIYSQEDFNEIQEIFIFISMWAKSSFLIKYRSTEGSHKLVQKTLLPPMRMNIIYFVSKLYIKKLEKQAIYIRTAWYPGEMNQRNN